MLGGLRLVSVQQGFDPRDFALVAFGGAGPLHANALGRLTGAWSVIVPPSPGVTNRFQCSGTRTVLKPAALMKRMSSSATYTSRNVSQKRAAASGPINPSTTPAISPGESARAKRNM